jgi:hypothetical protein
MGLKRGQKPVRELVRLKRSSDVRQLDLCAHCGHMGLRPSMIRGVLINGYGYYTGTPGHGFAIGEYLHGRCVVRIGGVELLKLIPRRATFPLTVADIGIAAMSELLSNGPALGPRKSAKRRTK